MAPPSSKRRTTPSVVPSAAELSNDERIKRPATALFSQKKESGNKGSSMTPAAASKMRRVLLGICAANLLVVACLVPREDSLKDPLNIQRNLSLLLESPQQNLLVAAVAEAEVNSDWKPSEFMGDKYQALKSKPKHLCHAIEQYVEPLKIQQAVQIFQDYYDEKSEAITRNSKALLPFGPSLQVSCTNLTKFNGGSLCVPHSTKLECHILKSGGAGDTWDWEQAAVDALRGGSTSCTAHKLDCNMPSTTITTIHKNKPKSSNHLHFYNHCLSDRFYSDTQGRSHILYSDWLELAQLDANIQPLLLKMEAPKSLTSNSNHNNNNNIDNSLMATLMAMLQQNQRILGMNLASILPQQLLLDIPPDPELTRLLFLEGGYIPISQKPSLKCPTCYQVLFLQVLC